MAITREQRASFAPSQHQQASDTAHRRIGRDIAVGGIFAGIGFWPGAGFFVGKAIGDRDTCRFERECAEQAARFGGSK